MAWLRHVLGCDGIGDDLMEEICTACFLECHKGDGKASNGGYPCPRDLRLWARAHKNDPEGFVFEGGAVENEGGGPSAKASGRD